MNIKNLFYAIFCLLLLVNCADRDSEVKKEETVTPTPTPTPTPQPQKATLQLTSTGRTDYTGILLWVSLDETKEIVEVQKQLSADGKLTLDLSEFIGKKLYIRAVEKQNNTYPTISNEIVISVEAGKTYSQVLVIKEKEAEKIYDAKITVYKDGALASGITVYETTEHQFAILKLTFVLGNENLSGLNSATTNSQGVADFKDVKVTVFSKHVFFIITKKGGRNGLVITPTEYQSVTLNMDGTEQSGQLEFKTNQTSLSVQLSSDSSIPSGTKVGLYKIASGNFEGLVVNDETVKYFLVEEAVVSNRKVEFKELAESADYYIRVIENGNNCIYSKFVKVDVKKDVQNTANLEILQNEGFIKLANNSSNPYYVTLKYENGTSETFEMSGKTNQTKTVKKGKISVYVKQKSGYVFYPTEETHNAITECKKTTTVSFPNS